MPNRIIKESIWTSPNLNNLSLGAERHFFRLLPSADDWGCMDITPVTVKGRCYPLQETTTTKDIEGWNKELSENHLIKIWGDKGRVYGQFVSFHIHNEIIERHNPKTPCPPWIITQKGYDPRLPDRTLEAYKRIKIAIEELSKNSHKPTLRDIAVEAKSSLTTVSRYIKQPIKTHVTDDVTDNVTDVTDVTDITDKY